MQIKKFMLLYVSNKIESVIVTSQGMIILSFLIIKIHLIRRIKYGKGFQNFC